MCDIIRFKSITCIRFTLKHYTEDGIPRDELEGPCLLTHIGGTHAPIVNILVIYFIKIKHLEKLRHEGA